MKEIFQKKKKKRKEKEKSRLEVDEFMLIDQIVYTQYVNWYVYINLEMIKMMLLKRKEFVICMI